MDTLIIYFKKIKWLFIILFIIIFLAGYIGLMVYMVDKYPRKEDAIIALMVGGLIGSALLIAAGWQIGIWLKKNWIEAKAEVASNVAMTKSIGSPIEDGDHQGDEESSNVADAETPVHETVARARALEDKALNCIQIASRLFSHLRSNPETDNLIEMQAVDFMVMSDSSIRNTLTRLHLNGEQNDSSMSQGPSIKTTVAIDPVKPVSRYDIAKGKA